METLLNDRGIIEHLTQMTETIQKTEELKSELSMQEARKQMLQREHEEFQKAIVIQPMDSSHQHQQQHHQLQHHMGGGGMHLQVGWLDCWCTLQVGGTGRNRIKKRKEEEKEEKRQVIYCNRSLELILTSRPLKLLI